MNDRLSILALLVALAAAAPRSPGQERAAPPSTPASAPAASNTVTSERTVQIIWEPDAPPPDLSGVLARLLGGESVSLARRILGVQEPEVAKRLTTRYGTEVTAHSCKLSLRVNLDGVAGARRASKEYADALAERLSALLADARQEEAAVRANRVQRELVELQQKLEATRTESRDRQAKLLTVAGRADLSAATLQASIGKLEDERQRLELELAGMEARLEAVQDQMKEAARQAKDQLAADPVIPELEKAVTAREELVKITRRQFESGIAAATEVSKAEADLVDAKVQLLDRRGAASSRGGEALSPLTRELQNLGIDIRDRKARLAHVAKRLEPLRSVAEGFQELEWMQDESATLRRALEETQARSREVQRQLDAAPVDRVIVVTARDTQADVRTP